MRGISCIIPKYQDRGPFRIYPKIPFLSSWSAATAPLIIPNVRMQGAGVWKAYIAFIMIVYNNVRSPGCISYIYLYPCSLPGYLPAHIYNPPPVSGAARVVIE